MSQSKIEWTGATLNTVVGCTPQGPECDNCYADDEVHRFARVYLDPPGLVEIQGRAKKDGLTWLPTAPDGRSLGKGAKWTGRFRLLPHKLLEPLRVAEAERWFANSLSDLFHRHIVDDDVGHRFVAANFGLFAITPQHTYQILTKQPEAAARFFAAVAKKAASRKVSPAKYCVVELLAELRRAAAASEGTPAQKRFFRAAAWAEKRWLARRWDRQFHTKRMIKHHVDKIIDAWPLPNVHAGVSVGLAKTKHRIDSLRRLPAARRFVSFEPLLGDLGALDLDEIDWAIFGGESGQHARPCDLEWLEHGVEQAQDQGVAVFVKQLGAKPVRDGEPWSISDAKGAKVAEWPWSLRVREMPEAEVTSG